MNIIRPRAQLLAPIIVLASCTGQSGSDGVQPEASESSTDATDGASNESTSEGSDDEPLPCASGRSGQAIIEFLNAPQNPDIDATCSVAAITGDGFALDCSDGERGPLYEFGYELDPEGEAQAMPFALGQVVGLEYVIGPAWSWAIRDQQGRPLIIHYESAPSAAGELNPSFDLTTIAPLQVSLVDGLCTKNCQDDSDFLPPVCLCYRGLGLEFESGASPLVLTAGRTGTLYGEAEGRVFVDSAYVYDDCPESEIDYYTSFVWIFIGGR